MMCSACGLNKQGDSRQPCHTPFSILNQLVVLYRVLTVAFWPTYRFLRRQVRWSGIPISLRVFHSHDPYSQRFLCSRWNKIFLKSPCFFYNPANVGNLISSSSSFSKPSLDIWNFLIHIILKPRIQDFKHNLTSTGDECNCPMISTFFGAALLGNWDEDWPFPVLWPLLGLPDLLRT